MEMQPDQGCCHPGLLGNSLCHDGLHNFFGLGARVVVELWEQAVPWIGTNGVCKEEWTDKAEYQQATHGTRHGFVSHAFGDKSRPLQQRGAFRKIQVLDEGPENVCKHAAFCYSWCLSP
ncbi:hypothetical protein ACQ4PT_049032 [Festuca glaucescens]